MSHSILRSPFFLSILLFLVLDAAPIQAAASSLSEPALYVLISASIPSATLLDLAKDSALHDAPLILRGLVGASLQDTLTALHPVVAAAAGLEIDPTLFETYNITAVPAVVRACGARGEGPFAVVYGLFPSQALPILTEALPQC